MLAVVAADGARLDAGSVALAIARRWSGAGESVLFVDADACGSRLAERFGEALHADYSPAVRGLPSLIVAREPLTLTLLADHCYNLATSGGSLWALFGPYHPVGAEYAARWLAGRAEELAAVDAQRSVVLSASLPASAELLAPVLRAGTVLVVVAPVETLDAAKALWSLCRELKLSGRSGPNRVLVVEGDCALSDDDIGMETGMHVAGRLPVVDDDRVMRLQGGRRDRAFAAGIETISGRLLSYWRHVAAESTAANIAEADPAAGRHAMTPSPLQSGVNGADTAPKRMAARPGERVREESAPEGRD